MAKIVVTVFDVAKTGESIGRGFARLLSATHRIANRRLVITHPSAAL
jgi:hypothetical protein